MTAAETHDCPIVQGAGGPILPTWCTDVFAGVLADMAPIRVESDVLVDALLLAEDGPVTVRFCPFDVINRGAAVVIVGITPGLHQMFLACRELQRQLHGGADLGSALARVRDVGSFAGPMRTNLITMLDGLGAHLRLGIDSTARLFDDRSDLLHGTSALLHPVFRRGENYSGFPSPETVPALRCFVDQVLAGELACVPGALVVPLGRSVEGQLARLVDGGRLDPGRCLFGFPHPSGGNGHRVRQFRERFDDLHRQVSSWSPTWA